MNAVETIQAAIMRLEQHKSIVGHVMQGKDETELYVRTEEDWDEDGNTSTFGLQVGGTDMDAEIAGVFVEQARTIDAQLAILRFELNFAQQYGWPENPFEERLMVLALANAILGGAE